MSRKFEKENGLLVFTLPRRLALLLILLLTSGTSDAQNGPTLPDVRPFTPVQGSGYENVSQTNGSLNVHIPLWSVPQRGKLKVDYWLTYYSPGFILNYECSDNVGHSTPGGCSYPMCGPPSPVQLCNADWVLNGGGINNNLVGIYVASSLDYAVQGRQLKDSQGNLANFYYEVIDPEGAHHRLTQVASASQWRSADGAGYLYDTSSCALKNSEGTVFQFKCGSDTAHYGGLAGSLKSITDSNGNQITFPANSSASPAFMDTRNNTISAFASAPIDSSCPSGTVVEQKWVPPGSSNPIILCSNSTDYHTNFFNGQGYPDFNDGVNQNQEAVGSLWQINRVILPTGNTYSFEYGGAGAPFGELSKLTLTTGGYISYNWWHTLDAICGVVKSGGTEVSGVGGRSVYEPSSATVATWTYKTNAGGADYASGSVTDPYGNKTELTFTSPGAYSTANGCARYPHIAVHKDASGSVFRTETTEYQWFPSDLVNQNVTVQDPLVLEGLPTSITTSWPDGRTKKTVTSPYDLGFQGTGASGQAVTVPYGKLATQAEYAYGTSAEGALVSSTSTSYKGLTQPSTFGASNFLDLKDTESTLDLSSGLARTSVYGYDDATHGNLTSLKRHLNTTNADLETTLGYTSMGMVNYQKLPSDTATPDTTTSSEYSSAYQGVVPTTITDALSHPTTATYDPASLRLITAKDANNQTTTYDYYGDGRLYHIYRPDTGVTTYAYPSANEVDETVKQDNSRNVVTKTFYDGLGRKIRVVTQGGCADGSDISVETTYDLMDRVRSVTNPHCGSGSYGTTYYGSANLPQNDGYDALGRPILLTNPDGTTKTWVYNDRSIDPVNDSVKITDEVGHTTAHITDALGHLVGVAEPNGAKTTYVMDAFGDLTDANQSGVSNESARTRHFIYDSLGRLTSATNPETGTIGYIYDNHGNVKSKTDALGVTTSYVYDALNRLTQRSYSNGTSSECWSYDSAVNGVGRLAQQWTQPPSCSSNAGANALTSKTITQYDEVGRVKLEKQCVLAICTNDGALAFGYDLAGDLTTYNVPTARDLMTIGVGYNAAGWPNAFTSNVAGSQSSPANLLNISDFSPTGALSGGTVGTNLSVTKNYDSRLRSTSEVIRVQ
jgi:YD repeat-containing protein